VADAVVVREGSMPVDRILLLSMPFGALERPALGLSLLKAGLKDLPIGCDINYLNFTFAEFVGHGLYRWMTNEIPYTAFAGDWTFTEELYGPRPDADARYLSQVLRGRWQLDGVAVDRVLRIRAAARYFVDHCMLTINWRQYGLVGFTSTFEQNIASLALAKRVKEAHPATVIIFGGANWEGEMGEELHRKFDFVDYVCSGEAENSFPALVERVRARRRPEQAVAGVVCRIGTKTVPPGPATSAVDMDSLPVPDFSDYFATLDGSTVGASVIPTLLFETSRGCWWGAKSHCTFCGLNGASMAFRSKSPPRALEELNYLVGRWRVEFVEVVDNILDMRYFDDFLPAVAESGLHLQLFYEVKANLSRKHLEILRAAGVTRIQPGIESLSDHVLALMRKGTTGLRNIQLLKWCKSYGIVPEWNLLYGFPGETAEDYRATLDLMPAIRYLPPPTACGPVRMDRFSPYFTTPGTFGLGAVRPLDAYQFLYPFSEESLKRIAYFFDYDHAAGVEPGDHAAAVIAYAEAWRTRPDMGNLVASEDRDGGLVLTDTRSEAMIPRLTLSGRERVTYEYCDEVRAIAGILRHVNGRFPGADIREAHLRAFLDSLVANRVMVTDGTHYLSLADCARLTESGLATRAVEHEVGAGHGC
jgi:ribosomal peptide maturation radical SAM protein 1